MQRDVGQDAYARLHREIAEVVMSAREATARTANALMTATYWEIGRRIVEFEQGGAGRLWRSGDPPFGHRSVRAIRLRLRMAQCRTDARLLLDVASGPDCADSVCKINQGRCEGANGRGV